ncbi:YrhC family protein [Anaerobacillus alkalilacustris]|nr:YrhC family protein [Anaerobacillus alkalilacustris]
MMDNDNNHIKLLKDKVTDYKRFAFILLALTTFMFVGLLVPNEDATQIQHILLIGLSICAILCAALFHRKAMKFQEQLYSDEQ